jgi:hypothetical protein
MIPDRKKLQLSRRLVNQREPGRLIRRSALRAGIKTACQAIEIAREAE